jgi:hypothetical protein
MFFLLVSCGNNETKTIKTPDNNVDSTIIKSMNNIKVSDTIQRKSDSITQEKIVKVITNIKYLTNTVKKLKIEKLQLSKQKVRVDTVFIETKKSFWGREKKTITTKSDSQDIETIDSTTTISDTIK